MNYRISIIEFVYLYHVTKSKKSLCSLFLPVMIVLIRLKNILNLIEKQYELTFHTAFLFLRCWTQFLLLILIFWGENFAKLLSRIERKL